MRILFATKPHLPRRGGAELTNHSLATALAGRGHEVMLLGLEMPLREGEVVPPVPSGLRYRYETTPDPETGLAERLESFRPDVTVVTSTDKIRWEAITKGYLAAADPARTLLHVHDVGTIELAEDPALAGVVACSEYLAGCLAERGVRAEVILPPVDLEHYRAASSRRVALMVNPVAQKGVDRVLALADARPDVDFVLRRGWWREPDEIAELTERVAARPNLSLLPVAADPGEIYGEARVLLVPSVYPEGFGRVAAEAQASGIPALATASGGLPEAVGDGGLLVELDARGGAWEEAFGRLWDDSGVYAECSARARERAARPELAPAAVAARFEEQLLAVAA